MQAQTEMSYQVIASLVCGAAGVLFIVIGLATPNWLINTALTIGLFTVCGAGGCASYTAEGSLAAARAFVSIGFLLSISGLVVTIVYYTKHIRNSQTHLRLSLASAVLFILAAVLALIGAIIFATAGKSYIEEIFPRTWGLGYSFALTIVGAVISGAAGGLALVHRLGIQN